jgi:hypothetical protein
MNDPYIPLAAAHLFGAVIAGLGGCSAVFVAGNLLLGSIVFAVSFLESK